MTDVTNEEGTAAPGTEPKQPEAPVPATVPARQSLEAGGKVVPIVPRTIQEVALVANAVIAGELAPDSYKSKKPGEEGTKETRARVVVGIMKGAEVGLPPITALSTIAIINNRPCIWGDGAMALIQNSGKVEWIREFEEGEEGKEDWAAVCRIKRRGQEEVYEGRFSFKDATRANLINKIPWKQYPQRMLRWRAASWAMRDGFADVLAGLSIAEEIRDLPPEPERVDAGALLDDEEQPSLPAPAEAEPEDAAVQEALSEEEEAPDEAEQEAGETEGEIEEAEIEPEPAPEPEQSMAERYRLQMFGLINDCSTNADLHALEAGFNKQKADFDGPEGAAAIRRIENRFAVKKKELEA